MCQTHGQRHTNSKTPKLPVAKAIRKEHNHDRQQTIRDVLQRQPALLEANTQTLETVFGASETLYSCDTYQFTDYSRYDMNLFDEAAKRTHRDSQFPIDLANARALGKRLVEKAKSHI